jgi:hypothetical protein
MHVSVLVCVCACVLECIGVRVRAPQATGRGNLLTEKNGLTLAGSSEKVQKNLKAYSGHAAARRGVSRTRHPAIRTR